ncbi:hypothetical protein ACWEOE_13225 [Amycolatopsis sp. NPDC004368]
MTFAWLSGVRLFPLTEGTLSGAGLSDLVRNTVSAGTLIAGSFALVYAYRKQRLDEAASFRADSEQFGKRYQDGAVQLGHERAAVRLAGVYAISRLADDWPDKRQMCVDLLCAYLRMPYTSHLTNDDESVVRASIFEVIRQHVLDPDSSAGWCRLNFDFSGGTYDDVQLSGGHFYGSVSFQDAKFTGIQRRRDDRNYGWIGLRNCTFENGVNFFQAKFHDCITSFDGSVFKSGEVFFGGATFKNFNLFFREVKFSGGLVYFGRNKFEHFNIRGSESLGNILFDDADFCGAEVVFNDCTVTGPIDIKFDQVALRGGMLDMSGLQFYPAGRKSARVLIAPVIISTGVLKPPSESAGLALEIEIPSAEGAAGQTSSPKLFDQEELM